jgi:dihydrofolate reductase
LCDSTPGCASPSACRFPYRSLDASVEAERRPGRELQLHGSGALARTLMRHDLIDEYRLLTYPVVLGKGERLFANGAKPAALHLLDSKTTGAGVTIDVYEPAGQPTYGSFELEQ